DEHRRARLPEAHRTHQGGVGEPGQQQDLHEDSARAESCRVTATPHDNWSLDERVTAFIKICLRVAFACALWFGMIVGLVYSIVGVVNLVRWGSLVGVEHQFEIAAEAACKQQFSNEFFALHSCTRAMAARERERVAEIEASNER